jgi:Arc/MetJ family transcription regulator
LASYDDAWTLSSVDVYFMHTSIRLDGMRTTLNLDDELLEKARFYTGIEERTALIHAGLRALITLEAGRRLAALGGTMPNVKPIPRRRSEPG